ncbi:DUF72 domain-containing protein [Candidatus Saccharibacteria bacterium]|nr:DUF72 domain-containing protein [Candidatus Saccharibacteria bacterium]NIV71482.1 DUF72 domain-containing protein [Calditrichia bacterium]NIV98036.1 DUF72 domain-containing protein [Candidatus Saccharibacteria bacterium]NIW78334.1 DUF72 domain-containing protein [Calditrichia bacterium]
MSQRQSIHIGTSGWNYHHWKEVFYPTTVSAKDWLDFYTKRFQTVEINTSFYQLPAEKTFENWRKTSPQDFCFAVKASRYITHMKKLKDPQQSLEKFMSRVQILGDKMGPILFQLPPRWSYNPERLNAFLEALPSDYRYTFEFRDSSWWKEEIYDALSKYDVSFCIFHLAGELSPQTVTADFAYVRLHGPGDAYQGSYDQKTLSEWAKLFKKWAEQGKEIYCYFDNDQNGYAVKNASMLQEMI